MNNVSVERFAANAMLVHLTISMWMAHRQDDGANRMLSSAYQLEDSKVARVWKSLLPGSSAFRKVREAAWELRSFHYANTLPYMFSGPRILPSARHSKYMKEFNRLKHTFDAAVYDLVNEYPRLREQARERLKNLYSDSDYPDAKKLRSLFNVSVSLTPLPVGTDFFRVQVADIEQERLKRAVEEDLQRTYENAMREVWMRLYEGVSRLHSALTTTTHPRRGETLQALRELAEVLPELNIGNDATLERMQRQFAESLNAYSQHELLVDKQARDNAAAKAQTLMNQMAAVMGLPPKMELKRAA